MSKSGGTLYIGVPSLQILGGRVPPVPQGLRLSVQQTSISRCFSWSTLWMSVW